MKKAEFSAQSGKSLVDMLIVLAVGGILISMAVVRMTNARTNMDRQNIAREFKVNLERARYDAVKRRAQASTELTRITIVSATSYKFWVDTDQDGVLEASEERTISFSGRSNVKVLGTNLVLPVTIKFDRFGNTETLNGSGVKISPVFTFCEGECTLETANVTNSNIISLSQTGTVAMLNGGESLPTFNNPTVSTVTTDAEINDWLVVTGDGTVVLPTPTPMPTATTNPTVSPSPTTSPTASPTVSPSPTTSPTASPSPTATATPTPNVVYCTSGQRPSSTGCTCKLPMTVRQNGKCQ